MKKNVFSENLRRVLEYRNITQAKLAKELHTSEACISRYVNGTRIPKVSVAVKIAEVLQVDINELVK